MISESFLNICLDLIFSRKSGELDISVYQDIGFCLDTFEKKMKAEIPISLKNKFDLLKRIRSTMVQGGSLPEVMVSIAASEKYRQFLDLVLIRK
jgi:hypothetical protein